jgi:hypothetical protein
LVISRGRTLIIVSRSCRICSRSNTNAIQIASPGHGLARAEREKGGAYLEVGELADLARQVGHANEVEVELP